MFRIEITLEFVEALAGAFDPRKVTTGRLDFIAMRDKLRAQAGQRVHPARMARFAIMPDIPSHSPGFAKGGTNPLTRKIIEIAHRGEDFAPAAEGFDPAEHDLEMLALIFRTRRLDEGPVDPDDHMLR
jgi:hypothetical protein